MLHYHALDVGFSTEGMHSHLFLLLLLLHGCHGKAPYVNRSEAINRTRTHTLTLGQRECGQVISLLSCTHADIHICLYPLPVNGGHL